MSLFAGQVGVSHLSQVQFLEVEPVLMKSSPRPALQTNRWHFRFQSKKLEKPQPLSF
jgi:hypothetical protein